MNLPNDYVHDLFLSYPHQDEHKTWVREIFVGILKLYLTEELGRPVNIFLDREDIHSGDAWPQRLKLALATSRILIPVWSIHYFNSDWCRAECSVMLYREERLGYRTLLNPSGLIHPVQLFDGKRYPLFARGIQSLDCTDYNLISDEYKKTPQYTELQRLVKRWVPDVAESIARAPKWMREWLEPDWIDAPVGKWISDPDFQFPAQPFSPPSLA